MASDLYEPDPPTEDGSDAVGAGAEEASDDDEEEVDPIVELLNLQPIETPQPDATKAEVEKALQLTQLRLQNYKQSLQQLQIDHDDLETRFKALEKANSKAARGLKGKLSEMDRDIRTAGNKYCLVIEPWINTALFKNPAPAVAPISRTRFNNEQSARLAQIAEIYEFMPVKLHDPMQHRPTFGSIFLDALGDQRSSTLNRLRSTAGEILDLPSTMLSSPKGRLKSEKLIYLVGRTSLQHEADDDDKHFDYSILPPLLFPPHPSGTHDRERDLPFVFKTPVLSKVLRCALFGAKKTQGRPDKAKSKQSKGESWDILETMPGMIAFAATTARFLCTHDTEFTAIGRHSKINYAQDFMFYKRMIINGLANNMQTFTDLIAWFDAELRLHGRSHEPDVSSSTAQEVTGTSQYEEIMAGLRRVAISGANTPTVDEEPPAESTLSAGDEQPAAEMQQAVPPPPPAVSRPSTRRTGPASAEQAFAVAAFEALAHASEGPPSAEAQASDSRARKQRKGKAAPAKKPAETAKTVTRRATRSGN